MNKTTIKVFQELVRNKDFAVESAARKFKKARSTVYESVREVKDINKPLTEAYKRLFLVYPYDFSFLTKNNLKILFLLNKERSFKELLRKTKLSRFTVHQLLKQLKSRGFVNKKNKLIQPKELIELIGAIKKHKKNNYVELPETAVIIDDSEERTLIQAAKDTSLPLHKTAFSAFDVISPYNYYTTKKKITKQDIFNDAKFISKTRREKLITALFYKKNKLKKDREYEELIKSKEFKEMAK